jgi:cytochrome c oxidase subunit IV
MADKHGNSSKGAADEAASDEAEAGHEGGETPGADEHTEKPHEKPPEKAGVPHAKAETTEHAAHAHGHKPNIKEYLVIFVILAVLTALEVGIAQMPGISKKLMALALVGLALSKAAIVGLYYMHLKHETRVLKYTVAIPMAAPALYAIVLISEAAWRLTRF